MTGTRRLVRLILRLDRLRLALWVIGLVVLMAFSADQVGSLYSTSVSMRTYVATAGDNPALVVFAGPGYGFDDPTTGAILVNETSLWMALACALMSLFLVTRHTRAEEEVERADLLRSTVIGRHATITATLFVAAGANILVALASAVVTMAIGFPVAGTIALTASFGAVGLVFAAATAVAAQVASTGRATLGLGAAAIGLAFVGRGIGDISAPAFSWLSPFGWGIGVRAYAHERWWTLAGLLVMAVLLTAVAYALSVRRDLGSGLLRQRPGPAEAAPWMTRPLGLAIHLQRNTVIAWSLGLFLTGAVYGSVGKDVARLVADNPELADYLSQLEGASITDNFLATALLMLALTGTGFGLSSALRNRSEESAGYAESMLATPLSRAWWAGSHLVVTVAGSVIVVGAAGLGMGTAYAVVQHDSSQVLRLLGSSLVNLPALLVLVGVATALFGWLPRYTIAVWGVFAGVVIVGIFSSVLGLPDWVRDVSPFTHTPPVPAASLRIAPLAVLTVLAAALVALGLAGFRRRDLAGA